MIRFDEYGRIVDLENALGNSFLEIENPARYLGSEYIHGQKHYEKGNVKACMVFPDLYEIGMANNAIRILYDIIDRCENAYCDRAFAVAPDFETMLRGKGIPLFTLQEHFPLKQMDYLGVSIGYELCATNILQVLDLGGIPLEAKDRGDEDPIVFAGGPASTNPLPFAKFFDFVYIGEAETDLPRIIEILGKYRTRKERLEALKEIPCLWYPGCKLARRAVDYTFGTDRDNAVLEHYAIASFETAQDHGVAEIMRGCPNGCRFCHAGQYYKPFRQRSLSTVSSIVDQIVNQMGYREVTLSSLSSGDYPDLDKLIAALNGAYKSRNISFSLPSLRVSTFSLNIIEQLSEVRKSGLTFAVEGGSQRLRDAINKNVTEEEVMNSCRIAFEGGWNTIKLYYMLGLPTETDEDIRGIAEMSDKVQYTWRTYTRNRKRGLKVTVSTSCFIPKPHTPFQWEKQVGMEEYLRKVNILRDSIKAKSVTYNWHDAETSIVEGILSRGDFRTGKVIESVFKKGGRLEAWFEYFDLNRWMEALDENGLSLDFYLFRDRAYDEVLPWDIIDVGVLKGFLINENKKAHRNELTGDCGERCLGCGAFTLTEGGYCYGKEKNSLSKNG